jgi:hypothetical protein
MVDYVELYYSFDPNECVVGCGRCFYRTLPTEWRVGFDEELLLAVIDRLADLGDFSVEFCGVIPASHKGLAKVLLRANKYFKEVGLHVNDANLLKRLYDEGVEVTWIGASWDYKQREVRGDTEEDLIRAIEFASKYDIEVSLASVPDKRYVVEKVEVANRMNNLFERYDVITEAWLYPLVPITRIDLNKCINHKKCVKFLHHLDDNLRTSIDIYIYCFMVYEEFKNIKKSHDCYEPTLELLRGEFVGCDVIPHLFNINRSILEPGIDIYECYEELKRKAMYLLANCRAMDETKFKDVGECPARFLYSKRFESEMY